MENKSSKLVTIGLVLGILIVVGIIIFIFVLFGSTDNETKNTDTANANNTSTQRKSGVRSGTGDGGNISSIDISSTSRAKQYLEGYVIIGKIEIPKIDIEYDILEEVTKRSIEIAVAQMYTTSALNQPGTTVIYGHNYRNESFFSRNDELEVGDQVYITDYATNQRKEYKIYNKFITTMTDTSFYSRDAEATMGKAETTLSTCTDDASETDRRLILQCAEVD